MNRGAAFTEDSLEAVSYFVYTNVALHFSFKGDKNENGL